MTSWTIAKIEWFRLFHNRMGRLAIITSLFVPLLYSGIYLYAFWNPYGSLNRLPVALVNQDEGGVKDGKPQNYGDQLVDKLQENIDLDWHLVSRSEAEEGIRGDRYYLVITIPKDFTKRTLSVAGEKPVKSQIYFTRNEGKNYIAGQIASRIESEIREKIGNQYTKEYVEQILDVVGKAREGIAKAASGARQLAAGSRRLAESSLLIQKAIAQATTGAKQLDQGIGQLSSASQRLAVGASQVAKGNRLLADRVNQVAQNIGKLKEQIGLPQQNLQEFGNRLKQLNRFIADLIGLQSRVDQQIKEFQQRQPELASNPIFQTIVSQHQAGKQQTAKIQHLNQLLVDQLLSVLNKGTAPLTQLVTNVNQLADGAERLAKGVRDLNQGVQRLKQGSARLSAGLQTLSTKMPSFVAGANKISLGNQTLANKLIEALESQNAPSDQLAAVVADPIEAIDTTLTQVKTYGTGLASYFLPLSLWIGALILYFAIPVNEKRWKIGPFHVGWVPIGKFLALMPIGFLQAFITGSIIHYGLDLPIQVLGAYYLLLILISWMSIAIIGFLIGTFGSGPGRLLAIVLLVLQLVSSGGTFPIELTPKTIQLIHPFLPMTYGVKGLREVIVLNQTEPIIQSFIAIALFLLVSLLMWILLQRKKIHPHDLKRPDELESL